MRTAINPITARMVQIIFGHLPLSGCLTVRTRLAWASHIGLGSEAPHVPPPSSLLDVGGLALPVRADAVLDQLLQNGLVPGVEEVRMKALASVTPLPLRIGNEIAIVSSGTGTGCFLGHPRKPPPSLVA